MKFHVRGQSLWTAIWMVKTGWICGRWKFGSCPCKGFIQPNDDWNPTFLISPPPPKLRGPRRGAKGAQNSWEQRMAHLGPSYHNWTTVLYSHKRFRNPKLESPKVISENCNNIRKTMSNVMLIPIEYADLTWWAHTIGIILRCSWISKLLTPTVPGCPKKKKKKKKNLKKKKNK